MEGCFCYKVCKQALNTSCLCFVCVVEILDFQNSRFLPRCFENRWPLAFTINPHLQVIENVHQIALCPSCPTLCCG